MDLPRPRLTRPLVYALLLHLGLACLFAFIDLTVTPEDREYFEVALAESPVRGSPDHRDRFDQKRVRPWTGAQAQSTTPVDLPTRRLLRDNEQTTLPLDDDKLIDESQGSTGDKLSPSDRTTEVRDFSAAGSSLAFGKRGVKEYTGPDTATGSRFVYGSQTGTRESSLYNLEWVTGGHRQLLERVLPDYPPGLTKEAAIQLKFTVLPDGSVDRILPLKKGDPRLEQVTLQAFKQWEFEALSPAAEQVAQEGKITFIFKLK